MSEIGDMWAEVRAEERVIHETRKVANLAALRVAVFDAPFHFKNGGDVVLVRDSRYPAVDFWPSTGKWRVGNRTMLGDAAALLDFLKRNRKA